MALFAQSIPIFTQHAHEITSCFSHGLLTIMAFLVCIMWRVTSTESTGSSYLWLSGSSYLWLTVSCCFSSYLSLTVSSYLWLSGSTYLWLTIRPIFSDRWLYMLKSILLLPNFRMVIFSHLNF